MRVCVRMCEYMWLQRMVCAWVDDPTQGGRIARSPLKGSQSFQHSEISSGCSCARTRPGPLACTHVGKPTWWIGPPNCHDDNKQHQCWSLPKRPTMLLPFDPQSS